MKKTRVCVAFICILMLSALVVVRLGISAESTGLEGIEWRLMELNGKMVSASAGGKQCSFMLDPAQRRATGYTGCNNFFCTYELDGGSLKFGLVASTRRACPEAETALEAAFMKALDETRGWMIKDGVLELLAGDMVLARFRGGEGDEATVDPGSITYHLKSFPSGTVPLSHGEYRMAAAPGSASEILVRLTDKQAFGTVNGEEAGAVVLVTSLGGSGTFYDLALLTKGAEGWENTDTVFLGDRVKVHSVLIKNNRIVVAMTTHGPKDPLCCPSLEETKSFAVHVNSFLPAAEEKIGRERQITGMVWQWVQTIYGSGTGADPAKPENYTIQFLEDGKLNVKADCNLKGGTYLADGTKLSIIITHSTTAACEPGSLEEKFVQDLTASAAFSLKGGNLYIDLKNDSGTMKFSQQMKR